VIDLWAERTAELGERDDVDYVLVFENRGPEVGATIAHPHGQIYAYDHVPSRQSRRLAGGWTPDKAPDERLIVEHDGWPRTCRGPRRSRCRSRSRPIEWVPDLPSIDDPDAPRWLRSSSTCSAASTVSTTSPCRT
jgi:UDPglucose--hexose-1-phosphate uridylyltransferase